MKIKNVSITVAQVGVGIATGVAMYPGMALLGLGTVAAVAGTIAQKVGIQLLEVVNTASNRVNAKLEALREEEVEIVSSPFGDSARTVN